MTVRTAKARGYREPMHNARLPVHSAVPEIRRSAIATTAGCGANDDRVPGGWLSAVARRGRWAL